MASGGKPTETPENSPENSRENSRGLQALAELVRLIRAGAVEQGPKAALVLERPEK